MNDIKKAVNAIFKKILGSFPWQIFPPWCLLILTKIPDIFLLGSLWMQWETRHRTEEAKQIHCRPTERSASGSIAHTEVRHSEGHRLEDGESIYTLHHSSRQRHTQSLSNRSSQQISHWTIRSSLSDEWLDCYSLPRDIHGPSCGSFKQILNIAHFVSHTKHQYSCCNKDIQGGPEKIGQTGPIFWQTLHTWFLFNQHIFWSYFTLDWSRNVKCGNS